jgi:hypothetical protein
MTRNCTGIERLYAAAASGAKARQFIAEYRRHECLLHPVIVHITLKML